MSDTMPAANDQDAVKQVQAALAASDRPRAVEIARAALESGVQHPLLYNVRSYAYERQGRFDEALADLRSAVDVAPKSPLSHYALGILLAKLGENASASKAFEEAVLLNPRFAEAHHQLGLVYGSLGRIDDSRRGYERALAVNPKDADSLARLAELSYRQGDWAAVHRHANAALALIPQHHVALIALAGTAIAEHDMARAEQIIVALRARKDLPPQDRAIVATLLGNLRDAQKRYAEAFTAYVEGNAAMAHLYAPRYAARGAETMATYLPWLTEYTGEKPAGFWRAQRGEPATWPNGAKGLAFIVGFPRSGTTLLENVLTGSPDVAALQEKTLFPEALREYFSGDEGRGRFIEANEKSLDRHRALYWQHVEEAGIEVGGKLFVDNHPLHAIRLLLIARLFPNAKIVFAQRDPRDVVLSCFRSSFAMSQSMFEFLDLERTARFYDSVMQLTRTYRETLGLDWYTLRHEALVENFDEETQKLCGFLGIGWRADMRDVAARAESRTINTLSSPQLRKGLNREGVGYWRHYREQLAPVLPILAPWVEAFGYPEK